MHLPIVPSVYYNKKITALYHIKNLITDGAMTTLLL